MKLRTWWSVLLNFYSISAPLLVALRLKHYFSYFNDRVLIKTSLESTLVFQSASGFQTENCNKIFWTLDFRHRQLMSAVLSSTRKMLLKYCTNSYGLQTLIEICTSRQWLPNTKSDPFSVQKSLKICSYSWCLINRIDVYSQRKCHVVQKFWH